jgi:hypothetical protein
MKDPQAESGGPIAGTGIPGQSESAETALVNSAPELAHESGAFLGIGMGRLPVELDVSVPVRNFRVRNLLALAPSSLIESAWSHGEDLPLAAGRVQLAWTEFEVIDTQLAVRVTRLV